MENDTTSQIEKIAIEAINRIEQVTKTAGNTFEQNVKPFRKNVLQRFPVPFLLLVSFGVSLFTYGIEQILEYTPIFSGHPFISLLCGIFVLFVTGTLYKKLS